MVAAFHWCGGCSNLRGVSHGLMQLDLDELAGGGTRQTVCHLDLLGDLEARQAGSESGADVGRVECCVALKHDECLAHLTPSLIRDSDDGGLGNARDVQQR